MIFRRFLTISALSLCAAGSLAAPKVQPVASADEAILKAADAFRAGDPLRLQRLSAPLAGHVLAPYL